MRQIRSGFTLVELLVVITILAIISVVAYQNFGGAVDKAVSGRKINDVATIETALQQFKVDKNYYPPADTYTGTGNLWGYNSANSATTSNRVQVVYNGEEIASVNTANSIGGGRIYGSGTWALGQAAARQIGAKGTISRDTVGKKYLSKDLYDPEVGDIKVADIGGGTPGKMIDLGIGRYVYSTFKKNPGNGTWASNFNGVNYNIAFTIKKDGSDKYVTRIVGDYDAESCYDDAATCPKNLIGTGGLVDGGEQNGSTTTSSNYGIPYAVTDFAQ